MQNKELSPKWPTVFELATQIPLMDLKKKRVSRNSPPVTQGLQVEPFPFTEGYFEASPQQIASLRVPKIEVGKDIRGFQREKTNAHARKIAKSLMEGEEVPPLTLSIFIDDQGNVIDDSVFIDDGQHRALGAVIARCPLEVIVKKRTIDQARRLFTNQGRAKNLRSDDTLLTGNSQLELYIQDAVTSNDHPWSGMVSQHPSDSHMTPTTMANVVGTFTHNSMNMGIQFLIARSNEEFDVNQADRLASLILAFGTKQTNPMAYKARTLRAISNAAVHIFRRNPHVKPGDVQRWKQHMPKFDFGKYPHLLNREHELAVALVDHWNKRLPEERKVRPWTYN